LWVSVFACPFQFIGTLLILRLLSGTRLYQLGLTTQRAIGHTMVGWLAWLLITPPVLVLHVLVVRGFWIWEGVPPEEHSLARLARGQPSPLEWILIVVSGVVIAPILEELLFRRALQGWAAGRPWGGPIILATALALMFGTWLEKIRSTWEKVTLGVALHDLEPVLFVLMLIPGCFLAERLFRRLLPQPYAVRAIYSTALLFAVSHVNVWPTPVPLFVLGLGLGYVAHRTQSLVGPIVMHALFNGVACVVMLLSYAGPVNGKETTSAERRPPSVSTSSIVPDSWLPRRTYASAINCPGLGETTDEVMRPTSLSAWKSLAPDDTAPSPANFNPVSDRFTWP
jgi:membrane protease YdiL (CAAX protease family)